MRALPGEQYVDEVFGSRINSRRLAFARPADGKLQIGAVARLLHVQPQRGVFEDSGSCQIGDEHWLAVAMRKLLGEPRAA